ncbi:MAG TPA: PTS fructose IIA subunit family protein [Xanthomonadaceae bacterium]|jgi:PTS system ascorbate-specific IIA component|nr:PTS fructose IIA subunit family protein [Xanthomonadaceae bacterium]
MAVGILLVTHPGVGSALLDTASRLLGRLPLEARAFDLAFDADLTAQLPRASAALKKVMGEDGALILTDVYGASPARLAHQLTQIAAPCRRVAGLSLPMLLRVMNYGDQSLDDLARTAANGGRNGVVLDDA